jgi:uncharacterized protein
VTDRDVRVVYTKYDGSLHWHQVMRYLGEDEHGIWLGGAAGSTTQRGYEPPIVLDQPFVELIPDGQWWTATFNGDPARTEVYCDIGTPPRWQWPADGAADPAEVTMVDLDLDVLRLRADQRVIVVDEDEFAVHQVRYGYPPDVISQAERAAAFLLDVISAKAEPFGAVYQDWLDRVG